MTAYMADSLGGTVESYPLDPPPDPAEYREVTLIAPPHIMQPHSAPMNADFPELNADPPPLDSGLTIEDTFLTSSPRNYLDEALRQQGLSEVPLGGLKQKWSEGGYDYEVRVHAANPTFGKTGDIYRVARRHQGVDAHGQGFGWEYIDKYGNWHHKSTLNPKNSTYNDEAARDTHIQLDR